MSSNLADDEKEKLLKEHKAYIEKMEVCKNILKRDERNIKIILCI